MSRRIVPRGDYALAVWSNQVIVVAYDPLYYERWGIVKPPEELRELYDDFATKMNVCNQGNNRSVDILAKNVAKGKLIKALQNFVQGFLMRNVNVTEEDRHLMGLPQRNTIPTLVPQPVTQVEGTLAFRGLGLIEMCDIRPANDKPDARAGYGVRIYYGIMGGTSEEEHNKFRLTARPTHGSELPHSVFTRRRRHLLDFTDERGKEVFFCMRYENSKGEAGPWGKIIQAFVP